MWKGGSEDQFVHPGIMTGKIYEIMKQNKKDQSLNQARRRFSEEDSGSLVRRNLNFVWEKNTQRFIKI